MPAPAEAQPKAPDGTPGKGGPASRAEAHAARKKSKEMRRAKSPGPGQYNPQAIGKKDASKASSSSFQSKTKRLVQDLGSMDMGDPGSYDPYTLKELASTSKKSFAKSNRSGAGNFGTREQRQMRVDIMGEATPGPGEYNGDLMMRTGKKANLSAFDSSEKYPSSSFQSKSAKVGKVTNEHVVGPGAYTPSMTSIEPAAHNPAMHFKAQGTRFEAVKPVTDAMVGPGAYESHMEGSLATSVQKSVSKASRANPGFGTLMPAHELPFLDEVQDAQDMPGPGAYEAPKSSIDVDGHSSAFKSASQRSNVTNASGSLDATGDPGAYDPHTHTELASTSKKSFGRSNRAGMGDFGGKEQRLMRVDIMGESTPGPGAYNGDQMMRTGKKANLSALDSSEKMPMSSFKSTSSKVAKEGNMQVPGAGAYTPNMTAIEARPTNPAHTLKAQGSRFKGGDSFERAQASEPGPGAYETEILRTGGRSALSAYDTGEQMASAAFASDTIRNMPWPEATATGPNGAAPTST